MAGKPMTMLEVAHQTLNKITDSNGDWSAFLDSAAWQYKRSFLDAVLIYAQRPDATACASMETWNTHKQLLRLIKPGSKAIYLLRPTTDGEFGVTWVFDVADTYSPTGNPFSLWTLPHGQQEQFIQELFQAFPNGDQGNKGLNLSDSIYSITSNYLEQHYSLALDHLFTIIKNTNTEVDDDEIYREVLYFSVLNSVVYCVSRRLGIDAGSAGFLPFLARTVPLQYGEIVHTCTSDILRTSEQIVQRLTLDTLVIPNSLPQNKDTEEKKEVIEDAENDEYTVQTDRGIPDTRLGATATDTRGYREIRADEIGLFEELHSVRVQQDDFNGQPETAFIGNQSASDSRSGTIDPAEFKAKSGPQQRSRSNGVDPAHEHPKSTGRGNRNEGLDTQISMFPTLEEQEQNLKEAEEFSFAFSVDSFSTSPEDISQDTPLSSPTNYRICNADLEFDGAKSRFKSNVLAIQTLKRIEAEQRAATEEEQHLLARFVGWGGIPQAFDKSNIKWEKEYIQLKELLTEEEYRVAQKSTLNSHYSSATIIQAIYQGLEQLGFQGGNLLDPGLGNGRFFGLLPEQWQDNVHLYGVELDGVPGRIAQQLYPQANIQVCGFESATFSQDINIDVIVGNVPYGGYFVHDPKYDKHRLFIHDYFIVKALDTVRPGGIVAVVTSSGTLDKANESARKLMAQRADLIGAVRLPRNAMLKSSMTEVTADILFFQRREVPLPVSPDVDWLHLGMTENGIPINSYFMDHPNMVLGEMAFSKKMYNNEKQAVCLPFRNQTLTESLPLAIQQISGSFKDYGFNEEQGKGHSDFIPAVDGVRNYSYTLIDNTLYYRINSQMRRVEVSGNKEQRIRGLIEIRDIARKMIDLQLAQEDDTDLFPLQEQLNLLYDRYTQKFGLISNSTNSSAFSEDDSYYLLCSLEILDQHGNLERKSDFFTKRTIRYPKPIHHADTAFDALHISISEYGRVDMKFMLSLLDGYTPEQVARELANLIFKNPNSDPQDLYQGWEASDEYLSGNVVEKLIQAKNAAQQYPNLYTTNVESLEKIQPEPLNAGDIDVFLGAAWVPEDIFQQFMYEIFDLDYFEKRKISLSYNTELAKWTVEGRYAIPHKKYEVYTLYGSERMSGLQVLEQSLNQQSARIYDTFMSDGKKKQRLNQEETTIIQQRQQLLEEAFVNWVYQDQDRRERLVSLYNHLFNEIQPRQFNGDFLQFPGMNPEVKLDKHQLDGVAHIVLGGNTLLAHCVGAGKTYTMIAAAMKKQQLGLSSKSMFIVPNHLTLQWSNEFLRLYPGANLLVATEKDFETSSRRKFLARIATGNYDGVIIAHSQFIKIQLSEAQQAENIRNEVNRITISIEKEKMRNGKRLSTIKQLEKRRANLNAQLNRLNDASKKDTVLCFEQLGIDQIFVDESDEFKNLGASTKHRNVAGISTTASKRANDLYLKCRYLDVLTNGKGIVFASGTPISNSVVELYYLQKYLQNSRLEELGLGHLDAWISLFGRITTQMELAPEGKGFRTVRRLREFYNIPEIVNMTADVWDVKTQEMLNLPIPKLKGGKPREIMLERSEDQANIIDYLAERATRIRNRSVSPDQDNMLVVTNDGRKAALDQRLFNPLLPDDPNSKVNACVEELFRFWSETQEQKLTQLVFCDLSTPRDGFNVYDDIKQKLISKGIPAQEIAFAHDAKTNKEKDALFQRVNLGDVRILIGSTEKMGAGTNVQRLLARMLELDPPWRPRDLTQRRGRIERRGNQNEFIDIIRFVKRGTFDAYSYQILEQKQHYISQIFNGKATIRRITEMDTLTLDFATVKALSTGDPEIREKMELENDLSRLRTLKGDYIRQKYDMENNLQYRIPSQIAMHNKQIKYKTKYFEYYQAHRSQDFHILINGQHYEKRKEAGEAILNLLYSRVGSHHNYEQEIGEYEGFSLWFTYDSFHKTNYLICCEPGTSNVVVKSKMGRDAVGNLIRLDNQLKGMEDELTGHKRAIQQLESEREQIQEHINDPFRYEDELVQKSARLRELDLKFSKEAERIYDVDDLEPEIDNIYNKSPDIER